jgi:hypothetical protein
VSSLGYFLFQSLYFHLFLKDILFLSIFHHFAFYFLIKFHILPVVNRFFFELCPHEVSLFDFFCAFEPKSSLHDGFDEIAVVPLAYINFKRGVILDEIEFPIYFVREIDKEEKFFEFVYFQVD